MADIAGLPIVAKEIATLVGVEEGFLIRASSHGASINSSAQVEVHERLASELCWIFKIYNFSCSCYFVDYFHSLHSMTYFADFMRRSFYTM
jgi:hypothetical protein